MEERGRTVSDIIQQYETTVRPMHEIYVEPSKQHADIIFRNHHKTSMNIAIDILVSHLRAKIKDDTTITNTTTNPTTTMMTTTTTTTEVDENVVDDEKEHPK
jgi:uridine kinase